MSDARRMTKEEKAQNAAAVAESRRQIAEHERTREPDPNEPTGPHLKTGYGLGV
jgi:hypothetical protein